MIIRRTRKNPIGYLFSHHTRSSELTSFQDKNHWFDDTNRTKEVGNQLFAVTQIYFVITTDTISYYVEIKSGIIFIIKTTSIICKYQA